MEFSRTPENYGNLEGSCIPTSFVRTASPYMIKNFSNNKKPLIEPFLHFRPLPPGIKPEMIDCRRGDFPRCSTCQAYLSPFVQVKAEHKTWRCSLCGHLNSTIHFTSLYDMRVDVVDRPELHHLVYDVVPPQKFTSITGNSRIYLFIIEEELLSTKTAYFDMILETISSLEPLIKNNDMVGLITYRGSVAIYDISNRTCNSYCEYDPSQLRKGQNFLVSSKIHFESFLLCLKSAKNSQMHSYSALNGALNWASEILNGYGGRVILLSTGRASDDYFDHFPNFQKRMISLSYFKIFPNPEIESLCMKTGGYVAPISNIVTMQNLFSLNSGWDSATYLRVNNGIECSGVYGNCSTLENGTVIHPVVDETQSITYSLSIMDHQIQIMFFQFAFRFTDNNEKRLIRVVNGKMNVADFLPTPLDDASIALYYLRKRSFVKNESIFLENLAILRQYCSSNSKMPKFIHTGYTQDIFFIQSASVERFDFSVYPFILSNSGQNYYLLWTTTKLVVFPKPSTDVVNMIRQYSLSLGFGDISLYIIEKEEEFNGIMGTDSEANRWFFKSDGFNKTLIE